MAYVSPIDVPADPTGAVSDVSRPLLHRMNQATLSASTLHALERLLDWANAKMPEIRESFEFRQGSLGLPSEATASLPITAAASIEVVSTPVEQFSTVTVVEEGVAPQERGLYTPVPKGNFDGGDDIVTIATVPTVETPVEAVEPAVEAPTEVPTEAPSETAAPAVESVPDEVKPKVVKKVVVKKAAE